MIYTVTYSDPAGRTEPQTIEVEGASATIDSARNQLLILDADGGVVAGFVSWSSFVPSESA